MNTDMTAYRVERKTSCADPIYVGEYQEGDMVFIDSIHIYFTCGYISPNF